MAQLMENMGNMATNFIGPTGGFDANGNYTGAQGLPGGASFAFNARTMNTQAAIQNALALGGGGIPGGMGIAAGILPAAVKIGEYKQMQEVAEKYYEKFIKDFNRKYGFTPQQTQDLIQEFTDVTNEIKNLIPEGDMREMYSKYIESYPTMYLSMIPAEALQTKLAVKCVTENRNLRTKIEDMSKCVSTLVKNLTAMQIEAGIPPIVNLMFESMPDPLTAMTDPMYHKYNDAIVTYHTLLDDAETVPAGWLVLDAAGQSVAAAANTHARDNLLRIEPLHYLNQLKDEQRGRLVQYPGNIPDKTCSQAEIKALYEIMTNMYTQTGCQPFGAEWNHRGPTPAMNPDMCLGENDKFQPGNPRHDQGRTMLYQAKRDPATGRAQWVPAGQVPGMQGQGAQMINPPPPPPMPQPQNPMSMPQPMPPQMQMQQQQQPTPSQMQQQQQQQQMYAQPMPVAQFSQQFEKPKARASNRSRASSKNKPRTSKSSKGNKRRAPSNAQ